MAKSTHFFGQSVFGQLIDLVDPSVVSQAIRETESDKYYKSFATKDHLISMLFAVFSHCTSLREICGAMMGLKGKLEHFGLGRVPCRATLSYSNKKRTPDVFAKIYYGLFRRHRSLLLDSQFVVPEEKRISIIDSSTISLFKDILKSVGKKSESGRQKGGIKVHTEMMLDEKVPQLVWYTSGAANDVLFLDKVNFNKDKIYVFDKGYIDYYFYERLIKEGVGFVTRLKDTASFALGPEFDIDDEAPDALLKDELIYLPLRERGKIIRTIRLRRVVWWDETHQKLFSFLTNLVDMRAENVAAIYKQRWQIELMYKQLKQNFPLKYFLGDNENAITIQIWCVLIANLLLSIIKAQLERSAAFSFIASFVRVNLINYIHLIRFLNNPEKDWCNENFDKSQLPLFPT